MKLLISLLICLQLITLPSLANECSPKELDTISKDILDDFHGFDAFDKIESKNFLDEYIFPCLKQVAIGAFDYLVKNLQDLWKLLELGVELSSRFGDFITGYLKAAWNGTEATFWAEQYIQGNEFFINIANSIKKVPEIIISLLESESDKYKKMSPAEKVKYVCHSLTYVGPDVILAAMGVWKMGSSLVSQITPKISKMVNAEKALKVASTSKVSRLSKLDELASTVVHNPRAREAFEFEVAGKVILESKDLKNLKDGAYLFVVDKKGNLAVSERFPNLTAKGEVLVTHPALKKQLEKNFGDHNVVSAGEFYVDAGVITEVNNKSGRFSGAEEHLKFGVETLKKKGLEVKPGTRFKDFDALEKEITMQLNKLGKDPRNNSMRTTLRDPNHLSEKETSQFIMSHFKDKKMVKEFEDYKQAYRSVAQNSKYKSNELGKVNDDKIFERLVKYAEKNPDKEDVFFTASFYLGNVTNESTRHFFGYKGILNFPVETRQEALKLIQQMGKE